MSRVTRIKRRLAGLRLPELPSELEALTDAVRAALGRSEFDWELVLVDDRAHDEPRHQGPAHPRRTSLAQLQPASGDLGRARRGAGRLVAVIDCDLQVDPTILPTLHWPAFRHHV